MGLELYLVDASLLFVMVWMAGSGPRFLNVMDTGGPATAEPMAIVVSAKANSARLHVFMCLLPVLIFIRIALLIFFA
jgi:hypothetical protein